MATTTEDRSICCPDCGTEVFAFYEDGEPLCWCRDNFPKPPPSVDQRGPLEAR